MSIMNKKIGYSFWGFLGDRKYNKNGQQISTPDGNAFYSWSILNKLIKEGNFVIQVMPDRDFYGYVYEGPELFSSWIKDSRNVAYMFSNKVCYPDNIDDMTEDDVHRLWDQKHLNDLDLILHEWRMEIPNRNDIASKRILKDSWQPDLFLQNCLINYCSKNKIKLVIFDLDYKLSEEMLEEINKKCFVNVFELGDKWSKTKFRYISKKVYIPFDFEYIYNFSVKLHPKNNLIYVGNRYERDWCIDKYIPDDFEKTIVYGNWNESGRDSAIRWPKINFEHRLQTSEMRNVYYDSVATILLAKKDYCEHHFMTARLIESIFYGTVPFFIEEYGVKTIEEYASPFANFLTVRNKEDIKKKVEYLKDYCFARAKIIDSLRRNLSFMDVKYFVNELYKVLEENNDF